MWNKLLIIIIFLLTNPVKTFSYEIKTENYFSFGFDYNSLLYEFEEFNKKAFYYNLSFKGQTKINKNFINYNFSLLYPFSSSNSENNPLTIGIGNINYKKHFFLLNNKDYNFSIFFNFKNSERSKKYIPVEEETYNFYGVENLFSVIKNYKLRFGLNFLKTKNYEIFQNKKIYFGFKYEKEKNNNLKFFSDMVFSHQNFDEKILVIPYNNMQPPLPHLEKHKENIFSLDFGIEYFSSYIANFIVFFQKKSSTIEDLSSKSLGFEGIYSISLMKSLDFVMALRYEKRWLSKEYTFFEPNILTDIGTSYIYAKIIKKMDLKNSLDFMIGRFIHDAREDFFKTNKVRYKVSISFRHSI